MWLWGFLVPSFPRPCQPLRLSLLPFPLSCTTRVDVDCLLLLVCCCGLLCGCRSCRFRCSWRCWNSTPFNSVRGLGANVVVMLSHNVFVPNPTSANCLVNLVFVPKQLDEVCGVGTLHVVYFLTRLRRKRTIHDKNTIQVRFCTLLAHRSRKLLAVNQ